MSSRGRAELQSTSAPEASCTAIAHHPPHCVATRLLHPAPLLPPAMPRLHPLSSTHGWPPSSCALDEQTGSLCVVHEWAARVRPSTSDGSTLSQVDGMTDAGGDSPACRR